MTQLQRVARAVVLSAAALVVASGVSATAARADMLPDPNSAEAHCTLPEQCPEGAECPSGIRQPDGSVAACDVAQTAKGLAYRCHRGGNYLGTAVYCKPDAHGSWTPAAPAAPAAPGGGTSSHAGCSRCAIAPGAATSAGAWLGGLTLLVMMGTMRIRRRPQPRTREPGAGVDDGA
jgi:hypothetical protein